MGTESELKYAVADARTMEALACDAAVIAAQQSPADMIQMATDYYDTAARDLSARCWTLRLRRENEHTVAACKTAGVVQSGVVTRGEWQCATTDIAAAIALLVAQGAPRELQALTAAGVGVLCGAEFTRRAIRLRFADGSAAELALDLGVLTGGGKTLALCELELELLDGLPAEMLRLAETLANRYGLRAEPESKFARAMELCV